MWDPNAARVPRLPTSKSLPTPIPTSWPWCAFCESLGPRSNGAMYSDGEAEEEDEEGA
uniref:Uncharacterized protein n=1 Tax=Sarcophilus harrisii TaxID=9305 RepID=A0A7N4P0R0_SARHA